MNQNDVTGCRISNGRTSNTRNQDNGPLAIVKTWKVLGIFKMEGAMWLAVCGEKPLKMLKWVLGCVVILIPLMQKDDFVVLNAVLGALILLIEIHLCYNDSSILKIKLGLESRCYCPNRCMTSSPRGEVSMNQNDVTGCRISNGRTSNTRNQDNGPPSFIIM